MNKLEQIVEILRSELADGKYPPGSRFPSEYELVRRFDVCRSTANKAVALFCNEGLLGRGRRGAGTRVLKKGTRLWKKVVFLGGVAGFNTTVLRGVTAAAGERGAQVTLLAPRIEDLDQTLNDLVEEGVCSGIITHGYRALPKTLPLPVVYIDEALPEYLPDRHYVANRNYEGAKQMMQALWERGHRNIVICADSSYLQTHRFYRVRGFLETLAELSRADVANRLYSTVEGTVLEARLLLEKIMQRNRDVTAVATDCDHLALLLIAAARELGISQDKLVITGFGHLLGSDPGADSCVQFPNVEQNPFLLGAVACNTLLDILEGKIPADQPTMQYVDAVPINLDKIPRI